MTDTTERAELLALADLIDNANGVEVCTFDPMRLEHKRTHLSGDDIARLGGGLAALCRLVAQDQKPVAYIHASEWGDRTVSFEPARNPQWKSKPLYLSPPPAAGWDIPDQITPELACIMENCGEPEMQTGEAVAALVSGYQPTWTKIVAALRSNAPPDTAATKSAYDGGVQSEYERGFEAGRKSWGTIIEQHKAYTAELETSLSQQPAPVAANASAEARWRSLSEDTSWIDGRDVVLLARDMEVQARYCPGEWSDETPDHPREYSGAVWSCFDDKFQLEIEECSHDPSEWGHDGATHWRPLYAHPHASDCDKQWAITKSEGGTEGRARSTKADSVRGEAGSAPSQDGSLAQLAAGIESGPSDRTADVTVEQAAHKCADDLVLIVEAATKMAHRTGNTFVIDRARVASMIAGHFNAFTMGRR